MTLPPAERTLTVGIRAGTSPVHLPKGSGQRLRSHGEDDVDTFLMGMSLKSDEVQSLRVDRVRKFGESSTVSGVVCLRYLSIVQNYEPGARSRNFKPQSSDEHDTELALHSPNYMRAFGDGPRHFEPWSSDEDDPERETSLLTTTPHQRENV
ncbi:hypothetical protein TNCV_5132831 [Trichonephila clavipes]|nr:hypothetical protein TNCV_5132831 [Trichonephila clavipes]